MAALTGGDGVQSRCESLTGQTCQTGVWAAREGEPEARRWPWPTRRDQAESGRARLGLAGPGWAIVSLTWEAREAGWVRKGGARAERGAGLCGCAEQQDWALPMPQDRAQDTGQGRVGGPPRAWTRLTRERGREQA